MHETLDQPYFRWLYSQVASVRQKNIAKTYWSLLKLLHEKEFVWLIPNDDNRIKDGRDLRSEFYGTDEQEPFSGCSFLEMLIALARRLSFEDDQSVKFWFWKLLENIGLNEYSDRYFGADHSSMDRTIDHILDTVIWRTYAPDGVGGLFPLSDPEEDQRYVELWYQQAGYLLEQEDWDLD